MIYSPVSLSRVSPRVLCCVIHALWTLQGLNAIETYPAALAATTDALKHPSAGGRRTTAAALPHSVGATTATLIAGLLTDSDGQVRLAPRGSTKSSSAKSVRRR